MVDLPFGISTVKQSDGTKFDIPNVVRIMRNNRIQKEYTKYLAERGEGNLDMSASTKLKILDACTASTRKSIEGLGKYIVKTKRTS